MTPQTMTMSGCPTCGAMNSEDALYCSLCGKPLGNLNVFDIPPETPVECPGCKTTNMRTDSMCRNCGMDLTSAKRAILALQARGKAVTKAPSGTSEHRCPKCGAENTSQSVFCEMCGAILQEHDL